MPEFYHVDRLSSLQEGPEIQLEQYDDIMPEYLQIHVDMMFPDGLSRQGKRYYLRGQQDLKLPNPNLEIIFEYVRQAHYPDKSSRF